MSGTTGAVALDISEAFDRVCCAGLFRNLSFIEFQVRYLTFLLLFLVIDGYGWFWMGSLHKNTHLMPEFLKVPLLVLL